jgi:hypothetical protein
VLKTAAAVLAFICLTLFSIPMSAQLLPTGNLYGGVSYGKFTEAGISRQSYRGWNGSAEAFPLARFPHLGVVIDASGFYRNNASGKITQYNFLAGPRFSANYGRWRPFVHAMAGIQLVNSSGITYNPIAIDVGGGVDYKIKFFRFKNFSWRLQGDGIRTNYSSATQYDYRASTGLVWRF